MKNSFIKYFFTLVWVIYFSFYYYFLLDFSFYKDLISNYPFIEIVLNYFNWFFSIFIIYCFLSIIEYFLDKTILSFIKNTQSKYDDLIWDFLTKFLLYIKYVISIYIWLSIISFPIFIDNVIDKVFYISFLIIAIILWTSLINNIFNSIILKNTKNDLAKQLFPFLNKFIVAFVWIIWVISIVWNLWYDISALITWAWIWWLAIALAAQKSIANIFWAITVILNKPFKVWDFVKIWWHTWTVKDIWLTYLKLQDSTWHFISIPNETIISSSLENLSKRENRKTDFSIWLIYDTDIEKLKKAVSIIENILEELKSKKEISDFRVNFDNFWDFSLNINTTYFSLETNSYLNYLKQKEDLNLKIKNEFQKENIEMAFPTQEIILKK